MWPDLTFYFDADPDPASDLTPDPDPVLKQGTRQISRVHRPVAKMFSI
jgi:hypothetical protein